MDSTVTILLEVREVVALAAAFLSLILDAFVIGTMHQKKKERHHV